jgi:hypothetical protein
MRVSKLLVEPHAAAVNSMLPSALLRIDLTSEVFLGVMKPTGEVFRIR